MKKNCTIIVSFLVLISIIFGTIPVNVEARDTKVLRVASFPLKGFFESDENGDAFGYGVEVLDKISQYSGLTFEYVEAGSWTKAGEMVLDEEADLVLPVTKLNGQMTEERFSFSEIGIIDSYHVLITGKDREELTYDDTEAFGDLKVAITRELAESLPVSEYIDDLNIKEENLIVFEQSRQCLQALNNREADAVITNVMDYSGEYKVLSRFCYQTGYICTKKESSYIGMLNEALGQIKLNEPSFFAECYARYYPDQLSIPLTKEEQDYVEGLKKLTFSFTEDQGYLSRLEDGKYVGVLPEIAKLICDRLDVKYEEKVFTTEELKQALDGISKSQERRKGFWNFLGDYGVDVWMDQTYKTGGNNIRETLITTPYFTKNYYMVTRKGEEITEGKSRIAVVKGDPLEEELFDKVSDENLIRCRNFEECFKMVKKEEADCTIVDTLTAEYYLASYKNAGLTTKLIDYTSQSCMVLTDSDNSMLSVILSKTLNGISRDKIYSICEEQSKQQPKQNPLLKIVYDNPAESIVVQILVFLIGLLILVLFFRVYQGTKENEILKRSAEAKTDFLSRMSHDIRTPMNAVLGMTYLAKQEENVPAEVENYLDKIESSGKYLLGLLNDILDMSKIENGKLEIKEAPVQVDDIRDSLMPIFETMATEKKVELVTDFSDTQGSVVMMDKLHTMQIYSNLISNAIKFSKPGGKVYWTNTYQRIKGDRVRLKAVIRDEGCGMSEEFLKKLFLPFERENLEGNEQKTGTGLGLSIVKSLVEKMGGEILVESKLGEGTTFTLFLNRQLVSRDKTEPENQKMPQDTDCFSGRKVLIAEDQSLNMQIIQKILQRKGMETVPAINGREALNIFRESEAGEFQLILMDIRMPEMDGIEAAKQIRALDREDAQSIPIVAMTANAYEEDREATREAGMNDHLAKPVEPEVLYATIKKLWKK